MIVMKSKSTCKNQTKHLFSIIKLKQYIDIQDIIHIQTESI